MENRFGLKDLILMLLVVVLIVMVGLQMTQYDRQWQLIRQSNERLADLAGDLSTLSRQMNQRPVTWVQPTTHPTAAATQTAEDPFERVKRIHSAPDYAPGDVVVDTFAVVPNKLTPILDADLYGQMVQNYVLEPLAARDPMNLDHWIPQLATSWTISDDQLKIEFEIRRGVTFSDGSEMSTDDVVYTVQLAMNKEIEAPQVQSYLDKLDHVEKVGQSKVRFVFKEPYFKSFETAASVGIVGGVLPRKFYSQFTPSEFNHSTGLLMGTGPYRLEDPKGWKPEPGKPVELVRNERYWGEPSAFKRLVWKVIGNPTALTTAFRNGETDEIERMEAEQFITMAADPKVASRTQHYALDTPTAGYMYVGWNEEAGGKPTRFADARVRRAMTMLIDRNRMVKDIMHDLAYVVAGPFSPLTPQADPSVKPLPHDPAAAIKLLEEAGFHKQGNTFVGPDGQEFHFTLAFNSAREERRRMCSLIKDQLAEAGIVVDIKPTEWSVMREQLDQRKFDAVCMGWGGGGAEEDPHQIFHSDAIAGTGNNYVHFSNKRFDEVVDKARVTVDEKKRMPLWHEASRIIAEEQPYTFLFADKDLTFLDGRFKGVEVTKLGLNGPTEWYVPKALQKYKD